MTIHPLENKLSEQKSPPVCGIVMPISTLDGCTEAHWADVLEILTESIEQAGFEGNLVSNADDVGIIQKRIIQNLYDNPVVVCDVSGKNPNVMFELGLRLAFDKPTIIVKDDRTTYSFDTSPIEHLEYPRDLRFSRIVDFKKKLAEKIKATYEKASADSNYTTFLKHFGEFTVAKLDKKEISGQEFILEELRSLRMSMRRMERNQKEREPEPKLSSGNIDICIGGTNASAAQTVLNRLSTHPDVLQVEIDERSPGHRHLLIVPSDPNSCEQIEMVVRNLLSNLAPEAKIRTRRTQKQ
ncbi:hypothetical protein [Aeromonas veronii]|uniref:hypothetical protein n=1 Tax=Aeromonas veronii TaxID=654 RepID=UPI00195F1539|nr:hypothetical protein [Aeromonas veronii]